MNPVSVKHVKPYKVHCKCTPTRGFEDGTRKILQVFALPLCHPQMNACPLRNCNGAVKTRLFCAGGAPIFQSHQWLPVDSRHACPVQSCIFSFTSFTQLFGLPLNEYVSRLHAFGCIPRVLGAIHRPGGFVLGCTLITVQT